MSSGPSQPTSTDPTKRDGSPTDGAAAASALPSTTRRGVSGMMSAVPADAMADSIRPYVPNALPRTGLPVVTHRSSVAAQAESVGSLRSPSGSHGSGGYGSGGYSPAPAPAPVAPQNPFLAHANAAAQQPAHTGQSTPPQPASRAPAMGNNPYLSGVGSQRSASSVPPNYDPYAPAASHGAAPLPRPMVAASASSVPNRTAQPTADTGNPFATERSRQPSGAFSAAPSSRPAFDPHQPAGLQQRPVSRPGMDPTGPHAAQGAQTAQSAALRPNPGLRQPTPGAGVAAPGQFGSVPISRPGADPYANRAQPIGQVRPAGTPISRPGVDTQAQSLRPSSAPNQRPGDSHRPSSRPTVDPYRPAMGRPSSNPGVDYAQAPSGTVRALVDYAEPDFQETLAHLAITPPLGEAEMRALAGSLWRCTVGANQVVLGQGEQADTAYWLVDGRARIEFAVPGKPVEAIGSIKPGDIVGEGALVGAESFPYTVAAGTECVLFAMGSGQFAELQRNAPSVAVRLLSSLAAQQVRRLRIDGKKVDAFASNVLGIVAPAPVQDAGPAGPSALGRLFNRFSGGGKDEP